MKIGEIKPNQNGTLLEKLVHCQTEGKGCGYWVIDLVEDHLKSELDKIEEANKNLKSLKSELLILHNDLEWGRLTPIQATNRVENIITSHVFSL